MIERSVRKKAIQQNMVEVTLSNWMWDSDLFEAERIYRLCPHWFIRVSTLLSLQLGGFLSQMMSIPEMGSFLIQLAGLI